MRTARRVQTRQVGKTIARRIGASLALATAQIHGFRRPAPRVLGAEGRPCRHGIIVVSEPAGDFHHDDARPDAAPQGLAQVEPRRRRRDLHPLVRAAVPADEPGGVRRPTSSRRSTAAGSRPAPTSSSTSSRSPRSAPQYGEHLRATCFVSSACGQRLIQQLVTTRRSSSKPSASASR